MTGRGALLAMLALFLAGNLLAVWLRLQSLAGLSFAAGCVLAACYARRQALLLVITAPPLLFGVALVTVQVLTSPGGTVKASAEAVAEGTFLTLAGTAPWLFGGVIVALIIALARGLPRCVRDLRADLAGRPDPADRPAP
jgi:hypothetical protein